MLAYEQQDLIKQRLLLAYDNAGGPKEMAAFIRHKAEGRLHCEVKIYFSPSLLHVAREVKAEPCQKPSPEGLSLFVGAKDSWLCLFPESAL